MSSLVETSQKNGDRHFWRIEINSNASNEELIEVGKAAVRPNCALTEFIFSAS